MVKYVTPYGKDNAWCEVCKRRCNTPEHTPFLLTSSETGKSTIICNACLDMALYELNIIPEDF